MGRLIDVDKFKADCGMADDCEDCKQNASLCQYDIIYSKMDFCGWLDDAPTVDAVTVKHGRWIKNRYWSEGVGMGERYGYYYSCSKCGNCVRGGYDECGKKYCDECGALMDGKDGDTDSV